MPDPESTADSLVRRAISARRDRCPTDRQNLPSLDIVGAAIARAARLAAAEERLQRVHTLVQGSQAAALLHAARAARAGIAPSGSRAPQTAPSPAALLHSNAVPEGRVLPQTGLAPGFIWRFHPAPAEAYADAGAPIALTPATTGASA